MELCLIWTQDRCGAIGRAGLIPWERLPEESVYFQETTLGNPVIMGRRTWEMWGGNAIAGCMNIVLSRSLPDHRFAGASRVSHLNDALLLAGTSHPARVFVLGGEQVFAKALPVAQRVYVTVLDTLVPNADAWAPELLPQRWSKSREGPKLESKAGMRYQVIEYQAVRRLNF